MNGHTPGILSGFSATAEEGGEAEGLLTQAQDVGPAITIEPPIEIPTPETAVLPVRRVRVLSPTLTYGALLSWVDSFADDFTLFADGINPIQLFNDQGVFNVGLVAPPTALTAEDAVSITNVLRPIANAGASHCGGLDANGRHTEFWWDDDGIYHSDGLDFCSNFQAVDESTTTDTGYIEFRENGATSSSLLFQRAVLRLDAPSYTPTVDTGHSWTVRLRYTNVGAPPHSTQWTLTLRQGSPYVGSGDYTTIKSQSYTQADITTSFANYTISLSAGEAALITDYSNLYLEVELIVPSVGLAADYRVLDVSQVYMTLPLDGSSGITAGTYAYLYTYVREDTGCESGPSPETTHAHVGNGCINLNDIVVSDDPTVSHINIYRTLIESSEFKLLTTIPNAELPSPTDGLQDCATDTDLTAPNNPTLDPDRKRVYASGLPPRYRYLCGFQNRIFGAGAIKDAPYQTGTASFLNGSTTVTGTGTLWTPRMVGRLIYSNAEPIVPVAPPTQVDEAPTPDKAYRVAKVNSPTEIVITRAYAHDSASGAYTVEDDRNANSYGWSAPGFPEDWAVTNQGEVQGETSDGITGIIAHLGAVYLFTRDSIYRHSGDDESNYRVDLVFRGTGCASGHTLQVVNNLIYFQAEDGWYSFDGQSVYPISSPLAQDAIVRGIDRTAAALNKARASTAVSIFDDERDVLTFFNSAARSYSHEQGIVYDVKTGSWSVDDTPHVVSTGVVFDALGSTVSLLGDILGQVWQINYGDCDGVFEGKVVAQVEGGTQLALTVETGVSEDLYGVPCALVDQQGNLTRFTAVTAEDSGSVFITPLLLLPFSPDEDYTLIVGVIDWQLLSGHTNYGAPHKEKVAEYIEFVYEPSTFGTVYARYGVDFQEPIYAEETADLTERTGVARLRLECRGHHIQIGLRDFVPGHKTSVVSLQHFLLADTEGSA